MKTFESDSEMAKQMREQFHLKEIILKLKQMEKEDKEYYMSMVVTTIVKNVTKNSKEAINFFEMLKMGFIKSVVR